MPSPPSEVGAPTRTRAHLLAYIPALAAGFQLLLSSVLILRTLRFQYNHLYIPVWMNPIMFSPSTDFVAWIATTLALVILLEYTVRGEPHWKRARSAVLTGLGFTVPISAYFFQENPIVFGTSVALSLTLPAYHIYLRIKKAKTWQPLMAASLPILLIWAAVEVGTAVFLIIHSERYSPYPTSVETQIAALSIHLVNIFFPLRTYVAAIVAFSWAWVLVPYGIKMLAKGRLRRPHKGYGSGFKADFPLLVLSLLLALSALYLRFREPSIPPGIDTKYYLNALDSSQGLAGVPHTLASEPRALYIVTAGILKTILALDSGQAVKAGFLLMVFLNTVSAYYLIRQLAANRHSAGLGALYTALGTTTLASLYGGIFANWLSLSLMTFAVGFYLKSLRTGSKPMLIASILSSLLCVYAHPWSGALFLAIFLIYLLLASLAKALRFGYLPGEITRGAILYSSVLGVILIAIFKVAPSGIQIVVETIHLAQLLRIENAKTFIVNLTFSSDFYVGGFLTISAVVVPSLIGVFDVYLGRCLSSFKRMLAAWLAVTSLLLLFSEQWLQWRILYMIPLNLMAGVGTAYIVDRLACIESKDKLLKRAVLTLFLCAIILQMFNYYQRGIGFLPAP